MCLARGKVQHHSRIVGGKVVCRDAARRYRVGAAIRKKLQTYASVYPGSRIGRGNRPATDATAKTRWNWAGKMCYTQGIAGRADQGVQAVKKPVRALISWVPAAKGGRKSLFEGEVYSTVVRFADDPNWPDVTWSLAVRRLRTYAGGRFWYAEVQFLSDQAPQGLLRAGARFDLYEGRKLTATGLIRSKPPHRAGELSAVLLS